MKNNLLKKLCFLFFIIIVPVFFFLGCAYETKIIIKSANKKDIVTMLKDFSGINGYTITYANDYTGIYRIVLGYKTIGGTDTSETLSVYDTIGSKDNKTILGQSTTVSTSNPPKQLTAALGVQITQEGENVLLHAQSAGDLDTGRAFDVFIQSLQDKGYQIEFLK